MLTTETVSLSGARFSTPTPVIVNYRVTAFRAMKKSRNPVLTNRLWILPVSALELLF